MKFIKILIIFIAIVSFQPPVEARMMVAVSGGEVSAGGCTTPTGDEMYESFGDSTAAACWSGASGTTCEKTWVAYVGAYQSIAATPAGAPTNTACTNSLRMNITATSQTLVWDRGSTIADGTTTAITFTIYFDTLNTGDWSNNVIFEWGADADQFVASPTVMLQLNHTTGTTYTLQGAGNGSWSTEVPIVADTWYTVTLYLHATAASSYLKVVGGSSTVCDADSECTFTRYTTAGRYALFGMNASAVDYYVGNILISTP